MVILRVLPPVCLLVPKFNTIYDQIFTMGIWGHEGQAFPGDAKRISI